MEEKGCHVDQWVRYILDIASPEERLKFLQKIFIMVIQKEDDETANKLIASIHNEYLEAEKRITDKDDPHYCENVSLRSFTKHCDYLRSIYWQIPERSQKYNGRFAVLSLTKLKIIELWMQQWQRYACNLLHAHKGRAIEAFNFLITAYIGIIDDKTEKRHVSKEEKDGILELFRGYTDSRFTPEIAEKWLKQPNVPDEIRKIFIIARARNGGTALVERDIKNAEFLKPLDVENRSEAALEFHKKFCEELAIIDRKVKDLVKVLKDGPCAKAEKFEIIFHGLDDILLHIHYKEENLVSDSAVRKMIQDIRTLVLRHRSGRYAKIMFILWTEQKDCRYDIASLSETVYFGS